MALPTRGQNDWDDEMANHISGIQADAQSAKANGAAAISAANNALNVAQSAQAAVIGSMTISLDDDGTPYLTALAGSAGSPVQFDTDGTPYLTIGA